MKIFNHNTVPQRAGRSQPGIGVYTRNGHIGINVEAIRMLGLKKSDRVQFAQDEKNPTLWYISISVDGYRLCGKETGTGLYTCTKTVSEEIRKVMCPDSESRKPIRLAFGEPKEINGITWYPLKKTYG